MDKVRKFSFILFCLIVALGSILGAFSHAGEKQVVISVNGKDSGLVQVNAGQELNIVFTVDEGVLIKKIKTISDNALFESMLNQNLKADEFDRNEKKTEKAIKFEIPKELPSVKGKITVLVEFDDLEGNSNSETSEFELEITAGSNALNLVTKFMPKAAIRALLNQLTNYEVPRINPNLETKELELKDYEALGLTKQDFLKGVKPAIKEVAKVEKELSIDDAKQKGDDKFKENANKLSGDENPQVKISAKVFDVSASGKTIKKSKVLVSIPAQNDLLTEGNVVVFIPKEVAQSADKLSFSEQPEILQMDPIIKWSFENVPQGQVKDLAYTVDGDATKAIEASSAAAAAEHPGWFTKLILKLAQKFIGKGQWLRKPLTKGKLYIFDLTYMIMAQETITISKREYQKLKNLEKVDKELVERVKRSFEDVKHGRISEIKSKK